MSGRTKTPDPKACGIRRSCTVLRGRKRGDEGRGDASIRGKGDLGVMGEERWKNVDPGPLDPILAFRMEVDLEPVRGRPTQLQ